MKLCPVQLRGFASPEHGELVPSRPPVNPRPKSLADLGPEVIHTFEVTNLGPYDVGNLLVSIVHVLYRFSLKYSFVSPPQNFWRYV
jgi:hypothetical protein